MHELPLNIKEAEVLFAPFMYILHRKKARPAEADPIIAF